MEELISTTKGMISTTLLEKKEGVVDNETERTTWIEYYLEGELVHRSVHITLKPNEIGSLTGGF